jgi:hypothetical protein
MRVAFMQAYEIIALASQQVPNGQQLVGWDTYERNGGSIDSIAAAFVASDMFANKFNGGTSVDPNSTITSTIASEIIQNASGHTPAPDQLSAWVDTSSSVLEVFKAFALGDQFSADPEPYHPIPGGLDPFPAFFGIYGLATGDISTASQSFDGWWQYEIKNGSITDVASAFIETSAFANLYNGGNAVDPNSTATSSIVEQIIANATGTSASVSQTHAWTDGAFSTLDVFEAFAFGDQYSAYVNSHVFFP